MLLEAAVQRDPSFGKAWAALAQARALGTYYQVASIKASLEGAETAARKALAIDDSIGLAHSALADVLRDRGDWLASEREYRRALELNPGEAETHNQYAQMLLKVGHLDEALEHAKRACELDPLASIPPSIAALIELSRNDLEQARAWLDRFEKVRGKTDGFAIRLELEYAVSRRDTAQVRRVLAMARSALAAADDHSGASEIIDIMDAALASRGDGALNQPQVQLDILSAQMHTGGVDPAWIWTPPLRPLRREPRFLELLKLLKLPDYWRVAGWPDFCRPKSDNDFECIAQ
jgi:tetratricopeptide (TPR) repeat protein